jgi:hypothetical protein
MSGETTPRGARTAMSKAERTNQRLKLWLPRAWGFAAGGTALILGGFLVTLAFSDTAKRDGASDIEVVYPIDL